MRPKFVPNQPSPLSSADELPQPSSIGARTPVSPIRRKSLNPKQPTSAQQNSHDDKDDDIDSIDDKDDYNNIENHNHANDHDSTHDHKLVPPAFLNLLATFPLFTMAPKSFHTKIASKLTLMQYHPQEYIIKKGDPSKSMYWILKGTVSVASTDGESIYAELASGSFFGEIGILFNRPRTATVVARTRVLVGVLTSDTLNTVLKHYPLVERRIRDEAQERLAMQDKKSKYDISSIVPKIYNKSPDISRLNLPPILNGINASALAAQSSPMPGPSLPPMSSPSIRSSSPLATSTTSAASEMVMGPSTISDEVDASISIQDFVKSLPIFQNLPSNIIHKLALGVEPRTAGAFEYILHKGDKHCDIYYVVNGEVEVIDFVKGPNNAVVQENILGRISAGSYFGEMAFLSYLNGDKTSTRSASIRSISSVELMVIKSENLKNLCSQYPFIADDMRVTAQERNNLNISNNSKDEKARLSINYLINEPPASNQSDIVNISRSPSPSTVISIPKPQLQHPQSQNFNDSNSLFSPHWDFNSPGRMYSGRPSRSVSPISNSDSSSISAMDLKNELQKVITRNTSFDDPNPKKRRTSVVNSSNNLENFTTNLSLPPMNPVVPSVNNFQNFQFNGQAQHKPSLSYLPHNKRIRLVSVSAGRRRSSVLSNNGPLSDRLLLKVFEFLPLPELMKLRIVCRRWRQLLHVAPNLFKRLDLTPWNTSVDDRAMVSITDFVGSRPMHLDLSNCFHVTDEGFSYMVNEIGMSGKIKSLKMRSNWEVSAMAIMDLTVPSVGQHLEEIDLSNCRKVRDNVLERLIGWDTRNNNIDQEVLNNQELDFNIEQIGCKNLKILNVGYCKHLTDNVMFHIAHHANQRLESLDLTRCTTITDKGFQYWTYRSFPNLKKLSLKDCTFLSDKSIISVANAAPNLEILDLNFCCALSDIAIEVLCMGCPKIRELDLSFCGSAVSDSSLVAISLNLRNLEKLILKGCVRVTRAGIDAILSGCSSLNYINVSQCKNAHMYPGMIPAQQLQVNPQTKSAFVSAGPFQNIIEIVI